MNADRAAHYHSLATRLRGIGTLPPPHAPAWPRPDAEGLDTWPSAKDAAPLTYASRLRTLAPSPAQVPASGANAMRLRCLIVDDHPLMRGALRNALEALFDALHCELASTLDECLHQLKMHPHPAFNLVLLDLNLPDASGTRGLELIRQRYLDLPILVVSAIQDRTLIERCLSEGAVGFLPKSASTDKLNVAIRTILNGETYLPPEFDDGYDRVRSTMLAAQCAHSSDPRQLGLTDRQAAVLKLIVEGFPNKVIGRELELAEGTVKVHVSAVLRALGVRNRTQAALAASRLGLRWRNA